MLNKKLFRYFAIAYRQQIPDMDTAADVDIFFTGRLSTLILDGSKSGSFIITVKDETTIGGFVYGKQ